MTDLAGLPDRECLAELLLRWEELFEQGRDTHAAELAKDRPDLVPELARRIRALKNVARIMEPPEAPSPAGPSAPRIPAPGGRLGGRYRLELLLAEGGFAQVYRAFDEELQRTVAIKLPKTGRLDSRDAFLAEARRVARLKHDGIVPVFDVGVEGDTCFIVSEFIEGGCLADRLGQSRPTTAEVARWAGEIADALEYAHLKGVIHRDIKPSNILVDHHGRAMIADFGIAQSLGKSPVAGPSLGTLRFMSPEQLEGNPSDHRSDIYSLGVVLHEMLTGEPPYRSLEPQPLRRDILSGSSRLSERLPDAFRAVCRKALALDPQDRQASAAEFAAEVRRAAASAAGPAPRAGLLVSALVLLGLVAVSTGGVLAWRFRGVEPAPPAAGPARLSAAEILAEAKNLFFQGRHEEAEAKFTAFLQEVPAALEPLVRRGQCRMKRGAFAAAVEDFTRAIERRPDDAVLYKHRAMARASARQFEPAFADYERSLALDPADRETRESFGAAHSIMAAEKADAKEFERAAELMTRAIAIYPESPVFRHQRGSCYFHMGEHEKALADLDEAIRMEPRNPQHHENRGHVLRGMGRQEEAESEFRKAEELKR